MEKQHHWKSEAKEDHQLSTGGPSNRRKSSGPNQLKWIALGRGHQIGWRPIHRLAAKLSTMIGLITKHADCRMTFKS